MNPLLICGASTRAAAFSAIRAGFDPICGDLFADADLRAHATLLDVPQYPHGLAEAAQHLPPLPWLYTGALENSPDTVDQLSQRHTLWGNSAASLKRCRNPWFCQDILQQAGLPWLELRSSSAAPPRDGPWLMKPLRSAAGRAIAVWRRETLPLAEPHYFQQVASGISLAAAFVATSESVALLGISEQLMGGKSVPEFGYCGSIFPWSQCSPPLEQLIHRMGTTVARECGLRGLFGIDLISDGQTAWLVEVNPRYTASMELIEHYWQLPLVEWHRQACTDDVCELRLPDVPKSSLGQYYGKYIQYADRAARAPDLSHEIPSNVDLQNLPKLADIPVAGTEIWPGQPVLTCLDVGDNPQRLHHSLMARAAAIWHEFTA